MQISNYKRVLRGNTIVIIAILLLLFCFVFVYLIHRNNSEEGTFILPVLFIAIALFIIILSKKQVFEYDAEGEIVIINNRNVFIGKQVNDEFPKYKVQSYEILNNFLMKKIHIKLSSRRSRRVALKYNIFYLSKWEITEITDSLKKIIEDNANLK